MVLCGTELIWEGKYDLAGNRIPVRADDCESALLEIERIERPRKAGAPDQPRSFLAADQGPIGDFDNRLVWGDNGLVLPRLAKDFRAAVDLIYIDPPFNVGTDFVMDAPSGATADEPASGRGRFAYRDSWGQGEGAYLQMIHERLVLLRELLSERGTIYVHCDYRVSHYVRMILDEIFGPQNYRNELIWCYRGGGVPRNDFAAKHDTIFRYTKSDEYIFNADEVRIPYSPDVQASLASRYDKSYRSNKVYEGYRPNVLGKHPEDWWLIQPIMPSDRTERLDYPTQKPVELIQRMVDASSRPDSLVLDAFCGSGTTLAVAEGLRVKREMIGGKERLRYYYAEPRRWIGVDIGRFAMHTSRKRLIELQRVRQAQGAAYRSFGVYGLGDAERRRWYGKFAGDNRRSYCKTILESFGAEPSGEQGCEQPTLDGKKQGVPCHVLDVNATFTRAMAEDLLKRVTAEHFNQCYCLAWAFAHNLPAEIEELEQKHGVRLRLVQIPREIIDAPGRKVPWFQAAILKVQPMISIAPAGEKLMDVRLESYLRESAEVAPEEFDTRRSQEPGTGIELLDFWAVDFDWQDDKPFTQHWQDYRTRKKPCVETVSNAGSSHAATGEQMVAVKAIDTFGYETVVTAVC
ncbi:MAG: site-specific DNA-methyltransferase [Planctomycetota bacterium]